MIALVIASNYQQYQTWRNYHNYRKKDYLFVSRPEHLYGRDSEQRVVILPWIGLDYGEASYLALCRVAVSHFRKVDTIQ
jgi:hypothetical protein